MRRRQGPPEVRTAYDMSEAAGLRLSEPQYNVMREAATGGYPDEVCGIIVGRFDAGHGTVARVVPTRNVTAADRRRHFEIPPADLVHEQRSARDAGLRILGFYHSHPEHPAEPSAHDLELAWQEYIYVIVPVAGRRAGDARAWRLHPDRRTFHEVPIEISAPVTRWA